MCCWWAKQGLPLASGQPTNHPLVAGLLYPTEHQQDGLGKETGDHHSSISLRRQQQTKCSPLTMTRLRNSLLNTTVHDVQECSHNYNYTHKV